VRGSGPCRRGVGAWRAGCWGGDRKYLRLVAESWGLDLVGAGWSRWGASSTERSLYEARSAGRSLAVAPSPQPLSRGGAWSRRPRGEGLWSRVGRVAFPGRWWCWLPSPPRGTGSGMRGCPARVGRWCWAAPSPQPLSPVGRGALLWRWDSCCLLPWWRRVGGEGARCRRCRTRTI